MNKWRESAEYLFNGGDPNDIASLLQTMFKTPVEWYEFASLFAQYDYSRSIVTTREHLVWMFLFMGEINRPGVYKSEWK